MHIWTNKLITTDKNIYCYYSDLNRLTGNQFRDESQLAMVGNLKAKDIPMFGLGREATGLYVCQGDGIQWVYENYPDSRKEINLSLSQAGLNIYQNLDGEFVIIEVE